jgi:hypothetical protein
MTETSRSRRVLEIATAVLLGLVSVATAVGAYQASEWSRQAGALEGIGGQLRDETFATSLELRVAAFDDNERLSEALVLEVKVIQGAENVDELRARALVLLEGGSAGLVDEWNAWIDSGHDEAVFPMSGHAFQAAQLAPTYGPNRASAVAYGIADDVGSKSLLIAFASAVFALSLLLLGVSGAHRSFSVSISLAFGGAAVFVVGVVISMFAAVG